MAKRDRRQLGEEAWQRLRRCCQLRDKLIGTAVVTLLVVICLAARSWPAVAHILRAPRSEWTTDDKFVAPLLGAGLAFAVLSACGGVVAHIHMRGRARRLEDPLLPADELIEAVEEELFTEEMEAGEREEEAEAPARVRLQDMIQHGPAWWQTELSGAHLLWWLCAMAFTANGLVGWRLPGSIAVCLGGVVFPWGLAKGCFWVLYSKTTTAAKVGRLQFYRWWGRGWLPVVIALLPVLLAMATIR